MSNFQIYAHPDCNSAINGKASPGHHPPIEIGSYCSLELAGLMALGWVCRKKFAGDGIPFAANTPTLTCQVWPVKHPNGEKWFIAARQELETPINQGVNAPSSPSIELELLDQLARVKDTVDTGWDNLINALGGEDDQS